MGKLLFSVATKPSEEPNGSVECVVDFVAEELKGGDLLMAIGIFINHIVKSIQEDTKGDVDEALVLDLIMKSYSHIKNQEEIT